MGCEKEGVFGDTRPLAPGESAYTEHHVIGLGDIEEEVIIEGTVKKTYLRLVPYAPPVISIGFNPSAIEKGMSVPYAHIIVEGSVAKGKELVTSVSIPQILVDIDSPPLPFLFNSAFSDSGMLSATENLTADIFVTDIKSHTKTAMLSRPERIFMGVIGKDPRIATARELMEAVTDMDSGVKGKLLTAMPGSYTFPCDNNFWFILKPKAWQFQMKTDLNFVPFTKDFPALIANLNTIFEQDYEVFCNNNISAGPTTYTFYSFRK